MKLFAMILAVVTVCALLTAFIACGGGDDDDTADDDAAEACDAELLSQNLNACEEPDQTAEQIAQTYGELCVSPDEMIKCACEAYRDLECQTAENALGTCADQYCYPS
jgi:hypothetical protein